MWLVTIAEEIEQSGLEGRVVISGSTQQHCQHSIVCRPLKPLTRAATLTTIPRYEVMGLVAGSRRRGRSQSVQATHSERVDLSMELSALPQVVLDILHKVTAQRDDSPSGPQAASEGSEQPGEQADGARSRQHKSGFRRNRAGGEQKVRSSRIAMDGHLTPLLSEA